MENPEIKRSREKKRTKASKIYKLPRYILTIKPELKLEPTYYIPTEMKEA